jgi:hypothetical protein
VAVVLFGSLGKHQHIIHEDEDEVKIPKYIVHHQRGHSWCIAQAKGYHKELDRSILSNKCCLHNIFFSDPDLMTSIHQIELTNDLVPFEFLQEVFYSWHRISMLDSLVIECPVVDAHPQFAILLSLSGTCIARFLGFTVMLYC